MESDYQKTNEHSDVENPFVSDGGKDFIELDLEYANNLQYRKPEEPRKPKQRYNIAL